MLDRNVRRKLYEYIIEEIGFRIISGHYKEGETLPNEDALCKEFDVSRGVLREASKVLAQKGLIQSRPKTGTRVQSMKHWNLFDADILIWKLNAGDKLSFLENITEVRSIIESEASRLAAVRASKDEIKKIRDRYNDLAAALEDEANYDYQRFVELDMRFHTAILETCHNEILAQIAYTMRQALVAARHSDRQDIEAQRRELPSHLAIVKAIENRNPEDASQKAKNIIMNVWQDIQTDLKNK